MRNRQWQHCCRSISHHRFCAEKGFSLLEVLVALVIMALSLGALYEATGSAVRGVQEANIRTDAVALAMSLMESRTTVPAGGFIEQGEVGAFSWQMQAVPYPTGQEEPPGWLLYQVTVSVSWRQGREAKRMDFITLLPEHLQH